MIGKNKEGVFFYSVRYKDPQGNTKQKTVQNKDWKTKKEAREASELFLMSVKASSTDITVDQLYRLYMVEQEKHLKARTLLNIDSVYRNNIEPFFAKAIVRNITPRMIAQWQQELVAHRYNNSTMITIQLRFRAILNFGTNFAYIDKNPFKNKFTQDQSQHKHEMAYWTPTEFKRFIRKVDDPMFHCFFSLLYWTGMRQGEAVALTIGDIDFKENVINVSKTFDPANHIVTNPKTSNSFRKIPMTSQLRQEIEAQMNWMKLIPGYNESHILFGFDKHINPTKIKNQQAKAIRESGVKMIRIHELRHSHVSLLINNGYSSFEIAKRLGHTPAMVENIYGHWFKENQSAMTDRLDEIDKQTDNDIIEALRIN